MSEKKESLVLFSGGKDSFITACMEIENDYHVILYSCNGGTMFGEENLLHGVKRLQNRYGEDCVEYAGIYNTAALIQKLNAKWIHTQWSILGEKYPTLTNCQTVCLHCQTAMIISAVAYARAKNISRVCTGYKYSDEFCTGMVEYRDILSDIIMQNFSVELVMPVWDKRWPEDDFARNKAMLDRSFIPKVLEPKCLIGRQPTSGLSENERTDMMHYFNDAILPHVRGEIYILTQIFKSLKLTDKSFGIGPTGSIGDQGLF